MEQRFSFDLPPSTNHLYRGRVHMSEQGKVWKQVAAINALSQEAEIWEGALSVTLRFHGIRGDCDNYSKALLDSLNGVAWIDDSQIIELHIYKLAANHKNKFVDVIVERCDYEPAK